MEIGLSCGSGASHLEPLIDIYSRNEKESAVKADIVEPLLLFNFMQIDHQGQGLLKAFWIFLKTTSN